MFTIEDECTFPLLQPQTETSETVGDCKCKQRTCDEYIRKIRPNKAEGKMKYVHTRLLRECEMEISLPLAMIFSKSLNERKGRLEWKRPNVVPVFKKGIKVYQLTTDQSV